MKLNWGSYIVIVYAIFIVFILYFVVKIQTDAKYKNELVVEEYYKQDAKYQEELNKIQNSVDLSIKPTITLTEAGITIVFPNNFDANKISGKVVMYRPSNKNLDFELPISAPSTNIANKNLVRGLWNISILWNYEGKEYITKEKIYY